MSEQKTNGYSSLQIALHWTVAALIFFQLLFGESMTTIADAGEEGTTASPSDPTLSIAHYWVGIAILCLVAIRLILRIVQGTPESAGDTTWMTYAAKASHWLFYILLVAAPATGLLAVYVSDELGDIHKLAKPAFIVLVALHAVAALFHQFVLKDGTLKRMLVPAK